MAVSRLATREARRPPSVTRPPILLVFHPIGIVDQILRRTGYSRESVHSRPVDKRGDQKALLA